MDNVVKIIIKDKIINKTVALKVKEETQIERIFEILVKRYDHPQKGNIQNILFTFRGEELPLEITLFDLITKKGFSEEDRIEIQERPKAVKPLTMEKKDTDFIKMMSKGGVEFGKAIVEILIKGQILTREIAESALYSANLENRSVVTTLIEGGYLKEKDILATVSRYLEIPSVDLDGTAISSDILNLIHKNEAEYYCILPIRKTGKKLAVAVVNPFDSETMNEIKMVTGTEIEPLLSTELSIRAKIKFLYHRKNIQEEIPVAAIPAMPVPSIEWDVKPLPEDDLYFSQKKEIAKTDKNKIIIKDGRKIGENDFSTDECKMATIWEDKKLPEKDTLEEEKAKLQKPEMRIRRKEENQEEDIVHGIDISDIASYPEALPSDIPEAEENIKEEEPDLPQGIPVFATMAEDIPDALEISSPKKDMLSSLKEELEDKQDEWLIVSDKSPISDTLKTVPFSVDAPKNEPEISSLTEEEKELENALRGDAIKTEKFPPQMAMMGEKGELKIPDTFSMDSDVAQEEDREEDNIVSSDLTQTQKVSSFEKEKIPEDSLETILDQNIKPIELNLSHEADIAEKEDFLSQGTEEKLEDKEDVASFFSEKSQEQEKEESTLPEVPDNAINLMDIETAVTEEIAVKAKIPVEVEAIANEMPVEPKPGDSKMPVEPKTMVPETTVEAKPSIPLKPKPEVSEKSVIPEPVKSAPSIKISREVTVRYYKIMNPFRSYPLAVLFSKKKLQEIFQDKQEEIAQTTGATLQVDRKKPVVKIIPHFPGCLAIPQEAGLDITPEESSIKLWVTPLCEGKIEDAQVQIWYQEKCMESIPLSIQVVQQRAAKISVVIGILLPILSFLYDIFEFTLPKKYALLEAIKPYFNKIVEISHGIMNLGLILGIFFLILAIAFYKMKKSQEAEPVVNMVDFS